MSYYIFNFAKTIVNVGPSIAKETTLAKILGEIDAFRITLSPGYDDVNKRYLESIQKMDNSKTIMLDLKGPEIKTRIDHDLEVKKGKKVFVKYTSYFEDEEDTIFTDYQHMEDVPEGEIAEIRDCGIKIKALNYEDGKLVCEVVQGGTVRSNKEFFFRNYVPKIHFVSKKDEKDLIRCVNNGIKIILAGTVRFADDIKSLRHALSNVNGKDIKIFAKIETLQSIENIEEILPICDGVLISQKLVEKVGDDFEKQKEFIIEKANIFGKPSIVETRILADNEKKPNQDIIDNITQDILRGADGFALGDEVSNGPNAVEAVEELYDLIVKKQSGIDTNYKLKDLKIKKENAITDYIIYNAYKIAKEFDIKVILCPSESGYTTAKLSALKPGIPIVSFTKNDSTYRYTNLMRGVKSYKVATGFNYENIKRIGKEIIRFMNKGDMSLEVKVLIVHSTSTQNMSSMINGIEIYRFKDL